MGEARALKLRYTLPALADLEAILDYIEERSPQGAVNVKRRIRGAIDFLVQNPLLGSRTDVPAIRRLATPPYPYLLFYEAAGDELIIHAIRHSSRNPSSMPGSN